VNEVLKYYFFVLCAVTLVACHTSRDWRVNPMELERDVSKTLQLFPSQTDYRILIVPDREAVASEHKRIYGRSTKAPAFYSSVENLIVIPMECEIRVLRHEVGHAVVAAYFTAPVPRWLHEKLAQKAEVSAPET